MLYPFLTCPFLLCHWRCNTPLQKLNNNFKGCLRVLLAKLRFKECERSSTELHKNERVTLASCAAEMGLGTIIWTHS